MPQPATLAEPAPRALKLLLALAVVAAALAPFAGALGHPFLDWDDDVNFTRNPHFRGFAAEHLRWMWSSFHAGHYMPLTWMSCALDFELAGLDARAFHATQLALHAATALLLYATLGELLALAGVARGRWTAAALGAACFAAHPLRAESVVWLTERRDVLSGAFLALSAWSWLRSQRHGAARRRWLALSIGAFAASLLSKVSGLGFPLLLLALDAWPLARAERHGWRPLLVEKLPYLALALFGAALGLAGQRLGTEVLASLASRSLDERLAISGFALRSYLRHTLLPVGLSPYYELPARVTLADLRFASSAIFALAVTVFLFLRRARSPVFASLWTAWLGFCVLLAPVIGLVHSGGQIAADRYTYLPSFAVAGLVCAACVRWSGPALTAFAACAVVGLGAAAARQSEHWRSTRAVFERVVAIEPASFLGHHKLGILAHQAGRHTEALVHYDAALAARPDLPAANVRYDRALAHLALGQAREAGEDVQAALAEDPTHEGALDVLVGEGPRLATTLDARECLEAAVGLAPRRAGLRALAAREHLQSGDSERALSHARALAELEPGNALGPLLAGQALLYLGRFGEAEAELARACELRPAAGSFYSLGVCLERLGRAAEARAAFERTLALDPENASARAKLGR